MLARLRPRAFIGVSLLLSGIAAGPQEPNTTVSQPFPAGVTIYGLLKTDLSTKHSKVGDPVELEVARSVSVYGGYKIQLLVPEHARLFGTVTMVRRSAKGQTAALAIHVVEARSKSGSQRFDGILGRFIFTFHNVAGFTGDAGTSNNSVRNDAGMVPLDGATVVPDPAFGSVLSSKRDFFLVKNETQLAIVTR